MKKDNSHEIAERSLKFLYDTSEWDWSAYPVSMLPYPKSEIRRAVQEYLEQGSKSGELDAMDAALIHGEYVSLSNFIDDNDAELVNSFDLRFGGEVEHRELMKTVPLPASFKGTDYIERYTRIRGKMIQEMGELMEEVGVPTADASVEM